MNEFSKSQQWDQLSRDFDGLKKNEELLIEFGNRQYTVRVATDKDREFHGIKGKGGTEG